jgi:hypothetical protein
LNAITLTPEVSAQAGTVVSIGEANLTLEVIRKDDDETMEDESEFTTSFSELENYRVYI